MKYLYTCLLYINISLYFIMEYFVIYKYLIYLIDFMCTYI